MPSASPFEQQGSICYINNRASDTFGAWGCDDLFCDDELYTSVSIVPNNNNNNSASANNNNSSNSNSSVSGQSSVLGNASSGLVGGVHHPMTMTPHLGHSTINSHQLVQQQQQQTLSQAPLVGHHHHHQQQQQPGQPHRQPQQHAPDHNHHHHQHHHQQQQQQQQHQLHNHLVQQTSSLAGSSPSGEFMAQLHPIGSSPPLCHPQQQQHHGANNNNTNNVNNNHSTAHKTIPLFAEASARTGTWEKKLPPDWDENDTTDWIFDLARKLGIPCEYFASCGTSLTGNHLLQMTEDDFQSKYPVHGREFYEAFQQLLRQIHHQHGASPPSIAESSADLIGLQNVASGLHQSNQQQNSWSGIPNDMLHHHIHQQQQLGFDRHPVDTSPYYYGHHHSGHAHPEAIGYGSQVPEYQNQGESYEPYLGDSFDPSENCSNETQSDPEEFMGGPEGGPLSHSGAKRPPGRPGAGVRQTNRRRKPDRGYGKLWEFIRDLLHNPMYCPSMVRWEDVNEGVFRIVQSEKLAALWGSIKNNPRMTYEKLSRAMRYYYKSKVFLPVLGRRLVYKFGPHAVLWKPENPNFERPCSDGHQT